MRIGVIGAMDVEVSLLKQHLASQGDLSSVKVGNLEFFSGCTNACEVVVVQCGVGMVNAAIATQVLADRFDVEAIINTGVAGSLDASIDIGDIVIATDAVNHVMDVCNLGYAPGQTPGFEKIAFPAADELADLATQEADKLALTWHRGRVASGDRFVRSNEDKQCIRETFHASCCEMEGAAIAQVCWLMDVPFALLRAISDKADGTDHIDYPIFEAKAARDCAHLTIAILDKLGSVDSLEFANRDVAKAR